MSTNTTEKTLRDRYFANDIFRLGEMVEDVNTGEQMLILDRGSNYVTVATTNGILKKWLNDITEEVKTDNKPLNIDESIVGIPVNDKEFELLESGQIKLFGFETKNFTADLSELILEQFSEFDDLYSKHQIIKCLDFAIQESNLDKMYDLITKVDKFYNKQNIDSPFIVEVMKNDIERKRLVEIIAAIAEVKQSESNYQTIEDSINALKVKYTTRKQWEVLWPFFKLAQASGLMGITHKLPFKFDTADIELKEDTDYLTHDVITKTLEDYIDLVVEDLDYDDIFEAFDESEFIDESLSIEARNKLSLKMRQHSSILSVKKERAMSKSASASVLMQRARRLAEIMVKRRIFRKSADTMTRQDKERFEAGASKRRVMIAKLAERLVGKVRMLQNTRMHHSNTPVSHTHDKATAKISNGAS